MKNDFMYNVPYMQKGVFSYKGREVPVVKLQYSFASDRNMLIAFLHEWILIQWEW